MNGQSLLLLKDSAPTALRLQFQGVRVEKVKGNGSNSGLGGRDQR